MLNNINQSLNFLISEYRRLKFKEKNNTITKEEKEALQKLSSFIGRDKNEK
jgi:hypothetical protein